MCVQCVRALLQLGANPNAKDMKGLTVRKASRRLS